MSYMPTKHAFNFFDEFKNFIFKGNMIDMAVGIIVGGAFGKLVGSLVDNVIMPTVGALTAGAAQMGPDGKPLPVGDIFKSWAYASPTGVEIPWGKFVGDFVNFLILGLVIFIVIVKFVGFVTRKKKEDVVDPPPPATDVALLMEIRDLLKAQAK